MPLSNASISPALIDFANVRPEEIRHVPKKTGPVNWGAVDLVIQTTTGSALQKATFGRKFKKAIRENGVEAMTPWFRYHYACARLALGDFSDYWGWEFRGSQPHGESDFWAAHMFWEETWLPKWGGGDVERLLVLGEQGIGDQILFASILPECLVRAREVVFECDVRLHKLLERSFPGLICRPEMPFEYRRDRYGPINAFIPAADLMRMFRRDLKHWPGRAFLKPDPDRVAQFKQYRGRTGIAWKGRQGKIDPAKLGIENPVSVQYLLTWEGAERPDVDLFGDIEGIVALCSVLDRVVTPPQSAFHFAGAVGTRTEIICAKGTGEVEGQIIWDHSTLYNGGRLPWYPNAQVYPSLDAWKKGQP